MVDTVLVKGTANLPGEVVTAAKRLGQTLVGKKNDGLIAHKAYRGFLIKCLNIKGLVIATVLTPPGRWYFSGSGLLSELTGYAWEFGEPNSDALIYEASLKGDTALMSSTPPEQAPADIQELDLEKISYIPRYGVFFLINNSPAGGAWIRELSPTTRYAGKITQAFSGYTKAHGTATSGFYLEGLIFINATTADTSQVRWSEGADGPEYLIEEPRTETLYNFIFRENDLATYLTGITPHINIMQVAVNDASVLPPYPIPYASLVREITPILNEDQTPQPLTYRDMVVAIPYTDSIKPPLFEDAREGVLYAYEDSLPERDGAAILRVVIPDYQYRDGPLTALPPLWVTNILLTDTDLFTVVPDEYTEYLNPMEDPPEAPPEDPVFYYDGWKHNKIRNMTCSFREPPLGLPPTVYPEIPEGAIRDSYDPAQMLVVISTNVQHPDGGMYYSTHAITLAMDTGAVQSTVELFGDLVNVHAPDGFIHETETGSEVAQTPTAVYHYAACGKAVPLVTVGLNTVEGLTEPVTWTAWEEPQTEFHGQETAPAISYGKEVPNSTKFSLVYAGGTRTEFNLGTWCPVRPVMRGMWAFQYFQRNQIFMYNHNDRAQATGTVLPGGFRWNRTSFDVSLVREADVPVEDRDMQWCDETLFNKTTCRRIVDIAKCSTQRIACPIGNGKIAILACPMSQQATGMELEWSVIVAHESTGAFIEERGKVFGTEKYPLESSNWISMTVQRLEKANQEGTITTEAIIVVSIQRQKIAFPFMKDGMMDGMDYVPDDDPEAYYVDGPGSGDNMAMHLAQDSNTAPIFAERNTELDIYTDWGTEHRISSDGGVTWRTLVKDAAGDAFFLSNGLLATSTELT